MLLPSGGSQKLKPRLVFLSFHHVLKLEGKRHPLLHCIFVEIGIVYYFYFFQGFSSDRPQVHFSLPRFNRSSQESVWSRNKDHLPIADMPLVRPALQAAARAERLPHGHLVPRAIQD